MEHDKMKQVVDVVGENIKEESALDNDLLDNYREKFKNLKLNLRARKKIAKELNIDEKNALNWKTVGDIFAFIDSSTLAKEHPKEAARILKLIAGILSVFFPVIIPITTIIVALPQKQAAGLVEWLGKPTPEHVIHKFAEYQAENAKDKLLEDTSTSAVTESENEKLERINDLYRKGILTEEEYQSKIKLLPSHQDELIIESGKEDDQ